jgi:hypothetical protein
LLTNPLLFSLLTAYVGTAYPPDVVAVELDVSADALLVTLKLVSNVELGGLGSQLKDVASVYVDANSEGDGLGG